LIFSYLKIVLVIHQTSGGEISNANIAYDMHTLEELWRNDRQNFTKVVSKSRKINVKR